jgi:hypothetical protein
MIIAVVLAALEYYGARRSPYARVFDVIDLTNKIISNRFKNHHTRIRNRHTRFF